MARTTGVVGTVILRRQQQQQRQQQLQLQQYEEGARPRRTLRYTGIQKKENEEEAEPKVLGR